MLALHQIRSARRREARPTPPPAEGFASPSEHMRFAQGMAEKGSSPEGIAWFLGGDS